MTIRPIVFSGPMVRAQLAGRKTQTRRMAWRANACFVGDGPARKGHKVEYANLGSTQIPLSHAPTPWQRVNPGDLLWVRETWKPHSTFAGMQPSLIPQSTVFYRADDLYAPSNTKWVPGIHMPRWASRLTLEVTATKIEPLMWISDSDAEAEGVEYETADPGFWYVPGIWPHSLTAVGIEEPDASAKRSFFKLWNYLHGVGAVISNPEVVALTFTVHRQNIDHFLRQREAA